MIDAIRRFGRLAAVLAAFLMLPPSVTAADPQAAPDTEAIEKIVRDYLIRNPEVIVEALEELERRREIADQERAREAIVANREALLEDPGSYVAGNENGDVTIVEFFDYRCPYCKRSLSALMATLEKDPNVRVVFKEFPILGEESVLASRAAIASIQQGKYLDYHNALMESGNDLNEQSVLRIAREVGLDADKLMADMFSSEVTEVIRDNYLLAEALGIGGTPAFVIGDQLIPGAIDERRFAELIQEARTGCLTC